MKSKQGFTLVELLVVVVIIAILTAAAVPMYEKASRKAQFVQVQTTLRALMQDIDAYTMENGYDTGAWSSLIQSVNCQSTTGWGQCKTDEGLYWTNISNGAININFVPSSKLFVNSNNSGYVFIKSIGQPWTWTNIGTSSDSHYYPVPSYNETFQMFCDWWINNGGKAVSGNAASVANASCK